MNTSLKYIGVLLGSMIFLSGCYLQSVHPLIKASESTYIDGLEGVYETEDQLWAFASTPEFAEKILSEWDSGWEVDPDAENDLDFNGYFVLFKNLEDPDAEPDFFIGYTGEINGEYYLNMRLMDFGVGVLSSHHIFPVNTFSKLSFDGEVLNIEFFKSSWIKDQILNNRLRIKHEVITDEEEDSQSILITASTQELRKFVEKYGQEKKAFEEAIQLTRVHESL